MLSNELKHGFVSCNGIRMHYVEAGEGPLVVLLHGFPECCYSWRHQFGPIANAGYRVVALDLRGYGQTDRPPAVEDYDIFQLTGDVVGLVHGLQQRNAVIVGHDWGAWIAAHVSLFRPDMFVRTVLLSVPYVPRRTMNQTDWEQHEYPGKIFYQAALRSPASDELLQKDVRSSLLRGLYTLSGEAAPEERFRAARDPAEPSRSLPAKQPSWISEQDINYFEAEFRRTGFSGGLNYYRNMDRNWAMTPFLDGARLLQPALFIAGSKDPVIEFYRQEFEALEVNVPNLRRKIVLPGVGHWTQQEAPEEVNRLLIEFLNEPVAGG